MANIILQRNQSARSIRNALFRLNEEEQFDQPIDELRGSLVHLKAQWKNFTIQNAKVAASEEDERTKRRIFEQFDEIEADYLQAKNAFMKKIREKKKELQPDQQVQENSCANNENQEQNSDVNSEELIHEDSASVNNNISVEGAQQMQMMNPQLMWQYHGFKSMENTWGEFSGSLTQWQGFHDRFQAAVHNNELIPRAFKFQYLKSSLKGQAASALGEWQLSDENYNEAWARLKELYEREYQTSRQLLWKIIDLPRLEQPNGFQLQKYCNIMHEVLRQWRSLKYPVEHYDMILVHLLHDRLDAETSKAWELKRESERPSLQNMLKFLDSQAKAVSGVHFFESKNVKSSKKNSANNSGNFERKSNLKRIGLPKPGGKFEKSSNGPTKCLVCEEPYHPLFRCEKFKNMNVPERKRVVRDHELCNNCFKPFHVSKDCFGKPCVRCDKKHNSLLCTENPNNKLVANIRSKATKPKSFKPLAQQKQEKSAKNKD